MSQHTSLKVSSVGVRHRNVLKRHERIRKLQEMAKWDGRKSVLGLPKVKSVKIKVRKAKSEKATDEKPGAAPAEASQPAAQSAKAPASQAAKAPAPKQK